MTQHCVCKQAENRLTKMKKNYRRIDIIDNDIEDIEPVNKFKNKTRNNIFAF